MTATGLARYDVERILRTVRSSAESIETAFASAGERLGRGLDVFDQINQTLSALAKELTGNDIGQATAALKEIAHELLALSASLPAESAVLRAISDRNRKVASQLDRLVEGMRTIAFLARSARIEAMSKKYIEEIDLASFSAEIMALTKSAQDFVEACARDHGRLTLLLADALARQLDFDWRYCHELELVANELNTIFTQIQERRAHSAELADTAAEHSRKLSVAVGGAIISLQSGDSSRQRLEHVCTSLSYSQRGSFPQAGAILRLMQAWQLEDVVAAFGQDTTQVVNSFEALRADTLHLVDLVRSIYGGDQNSASFLGKFELKLTQAASLIQACEVARLAVDRVTETLGESLINLDRAIERLNGVVKDIAIVGVNAGLRAARLGAEGRSLVVIANELKIGANQVGADAQQLMPLFRQVQAVTADLTRENGNGAERIVGIDRTMRGAIGNMRSGNEALSAALKRLLKDGESFGKLLDKARREFAAATALTDGLMSAAASLRSESDAACSGDGLADEVRALLDAEIRPIYTMASERSIHDAILDEFCPSMEAGAVSRKAEPVAEADDFLAEALF